MSREEEEGENYPDVCLGLGDDVLGGDGGRMLNLDVFERLVLFCRQPLFRRFLVGFLRTRRLWHLGEGRNFSHGGHTDR